MFCLNSLLLTKKKMVTTPVTKASDSPNHGLIKSIYGLKQTVDMFVPPVPNIQVINSLPFIK